MSEEKRIYVVVAEKVVVVPTSGVFYEYGITPIIDQPAGRQIAQCCHAVSKARYFESVSGAEYFEPVTTIILSARNNKELRILRTLLSAGGIGFVDFYDTNTEAYHGDNPVLTAICTDPVDPLEVDGILDHLPLWST